jgi:hypothetical protein
MSVVTHTARIVDPIAYTDARGQRSAIPIGPCLVEELEAKSLEVFWGASGEQSALLPADEVEQAEASGKLLLLD